jgi:large subunit ribosomal protein L35
MPKIKTHKSTAKRFKVSGTGKIMRIHIGKSHLRRRKPKRVLNVLDKYVQVDHAAFVKKAPTLKHK